MLPESSTLRPSPQGDGGIPPMPTRPVPLPPGEEEDVPPPPPPRPQQPVAVAPSPAVAPAATPAVAAPQAPPQPPGPVLQRGPEHPLYAQRADVPSWVHEPGHAEGFKIWVGDLPVSTTEEDIRQWLRRALSTGAMESVSDVVARRSTHGTATYVIITVIDLRIAQDVREEPRAHCFFWQKVVLRFAKF